ncbi:MAG TPA: sigma-70 family RNA polymerase sigma factor, partial [Bacillota bacterium]|nr:sigma-70 family RNA polymerase sigma factor [Bacillota bacterium]
DTITEDLDMKVNCARALEYIDRHLSERERNILILRYGLRDERNRTQREVASMLGISRSYVSRIEKNALAGIRNYLMGQ